MKHVIIVILVTLGLSWTAADLRADVKTQEKGQVKFGGMLGHTVNLFGGKAAREGVVSNVTVKGNRRAQMTEGSVEIIDLDEEKIYNLNTRKKTYKITTFEEMREIFRDERDRAEKERAKEEGGQQTQEMEIDFDVKETGQKKEIAGYATREVIATVTMREKGKTLDEGGGLVITSDMWLARVIPAMKEMEDFEVRYQKKLNILGAAGVSVEDMAVTIALYPGFQKALARMRAESARLDGTALESVMTFESVMSRAEMSQKKESGSWPVGGIGGMLAQKMMKKKEESAAERSMIMTISHQVLSVATAVSPTDLQVPADFKQK